MSLGTKLRAERDKRRLSLRDAAAEIGVSFNTLSRVERGADCMHSHALAILGWVNGHREARIDHDDFVVPDERRKQAPDA